MLADKIRSREELLRAVRSGLRPKYLFFWGHKPLPSGEIGKPCLSQWWPAPSVKGENYPMAEHYMMAEKARLFGDEDTRAQILKAGSPQAAMQFGRQVRNFNERAWEDSKLRLVVEGNLAKFSQKGELRQFLLGTGDKVLVEASPVDQIWGIGLTADNEQAMNLKQWRGLNLLGFALMEVRGRLREVASE